MNFVILTRSIRYKYHAVEEYYPTPKVMFPVQISLNSGQTFLGLVLELDVTRHITLNLNLAIQNDKPDRLVGFYLESPPARGGIKGGSSETMKAEL